MTKRILAIVMAVVICLSVMSVEVFASNITAMNDVKATYSGTNITISWGTVGGAAKYDVEVLKAGTKVNSASVSGTSTTLNVYNAGTFDINVYAKDANGRAVGTGSATCTIPQQSTQSGITVSSTSNGVNVSWGATTGVSSYYVGYTYYDANNKSQSTSTTTSNTSVDLPVSYDKLTSVNVRVGNSSGFTVGTWNKSYVPGGSVGNVTYANGYLSWSGSYGETYSVSISVNGSSLGTANAGTSTSYNVSNVLSTYANSTITFTVYAYTTYGSNRVVGYYTYYPYQQQPTYGNVYINGTYVSWQAIGTQSYTVTATINGQTMFSQNVGNTTSIDLTRYLQEYYLRNYSINVTVSGSSTGTIGSAVYSYNNGYQTGNVYINGTYVSWQGANNQTYTVVATVNGSTVMNQNVGYNTSVNLANYIQDYTLKNNVINITVYAGSNVLGTVTYSNGGVGNSGLKVEAANGRATISWNAVSSATTYRAIYSVGGASYTREFTQNYITLDYTRGLSVTIQYKYGNGYNTIGSASVSSSGVVTNNSTTVVNNPSVNGNTITGVNCSLTVNATTSTLTWQSYNGASRYDVIYTNTATGIANMLPNLTATTVNIPLGSSNSKGFTCQIVAYGVGGMLGNAGPFATVTYSGGIVNSNTSNKSEIKNLTLKESGNGTIVSWQPVTGATTYQVDYTRPDLNITSTNNITTTTSYSLPFNKNIGFEVYVYAYVGNRLQVVGSAVHVAGDSYTPKTEDKKPVNNSEPALSAYVTNFKGVATDKKVVLSWNAASGNPNYDVYWKRSSSSEWKKAKTTSKRALSIGGLNTNISYDFKVVANGKDSGVVTITTPKTGSTTVTAKDPAGAGTATSTLPEIVSVSSGKGTVDITWNKVKNATTYKVYVAENGSSTYYAVPSSKLAGATISINGTSAKISGIKAGTYKIRIKASTDNGKTWTAFADCDYRTVTVN